MPSVWITSFLMKSFVGVLPKTLAERDQSAKIEIMRSGLVRAADNKENVIGPMSQDGAIVYLDDGSEKLSAASSRKRGEEAFTKKGHFQSKPKFFLRMFP